MGFVLIERLVEITPGTRARAVACFSPDDDLFADHFPGRPIVPGVLLAEAMGQTGGWLIAATLGFTRWPLLTMIDQAKFRRLVRPGEAIQLTATLRSSRRERDFEVTGAAEVDGQRVASARFLFRAFTFEMAAGEGDAFERWARDTFTRLGGDILIPLPGSQERVNKS